MRIDRRLVSLAAGLTIALAGCGGDDDENEAGEPPPAPPGSPSEVVEHAEEWPAPNRDLANTRNAEGAEISSENVDELGPAWSVPIKAGGTYGGYASTPIIVDDVVYTQDLQSNVDAIDAVTGEILWEADFDSPNLGPNGVTIGDGKIFGATSEYAFAVDAETGEELWRSQRLIRNKKEGIDMAPTVHDGVVYVSTVPGNTKGFYEGNGVGILWALDAETGEALWKWNTVPNDLWDPKFKDINSGGGLWHAPAVDENGDIYISVANPAPWPGTKEQPWASSRPGPNLHSNTLVKLSPDGEKIWHQQVLPHDLYDWDLHLSPVLTEDSDGRQIVLTGGKMGYVYAVDRESGELIWKRAVGKHNGHDEDNLTVLEGGDPPKLPLELWPGILGGVETQLAVDDGKVFAAVVNQPTTFKDQETYETDIENGTGEMVALDIDTGEQLWSTKFDTPPYGAATVTNDLVWTTTFGGELVALDTETGEEVWSTQLPAGTNATVAVSGGTLVTAASYPQSKDQKAQVIAYRIGSDEPLEGGGEAEEQEQQEEEQQEEGGGGADGATIFSDNCASCHTLAAANASGNVGPNLDQLDLPVGAIQEQVENGGGGMPSFAGTLSQQEIRAVSEYVAESADPNAESSGGAGGGP